MSIRIHNLSRRFGEFQALKDLSLDIHSGELVALLGPSGSGKTTLLRMIAGLDVPDAGHVEFSGRDAVDQSVAERGVGFVFQHYALFRNMTVFENIAFGLRVKPRSQRPSKVAIRARVDELLKLIQLDWLGDRYPNQLSGGQRQRVALARALAVEPRVLLLDEPFGALDAKVRKELRSWLKRLHADMGITTVFVTHDQDEALEVADRVVIMNQGKIEQLGTPEEVYDHPQNRFVLDFLGSVNLFHGRIEEGLAHLDGIGEHPIEAKEGRAVAYVRPHDVGVTREAESAEKSIEVRLKSALPSGAVVRLELERIDNGESVRAELTKEEYVRLKPVKGDVLFVVLKNMHVFVDDFSI